jgi:hypothetical protein
MSGDIFMDLSIAGDVNTVTRSIFATTTTAKSIPVNTEFN